MSGRRRRQFLSHGKVQGLCDELRESSSCSSDKVQRSLPSKRKGRGSNQRKSKNKARLDGLARGPTKSASQLISKCAESFVKELVNVAVEDTLAESSSSRRLKADDIARALKKMGFEQQSERVRSALSLDKNKGQRRKPRKSKSERMKEEKMLEEEQQKLLAAAAKRYYAEMDTSR